MRKGSLLNKRHKAKDCVDNEYKKIKNVHKFLDSEKMNDEEKLEYQELLSNSLQELSISRFVKISKKIINLINKKDIDAIKKYFNESFPNLGSILKSYADDFNNKLTKNNLTEKETADIITGLVSIIFDNFLSLFKESENNEKHYLPDLRVVEKLINFVINQVQEKLSQINIKELNNENKIERDKLVKIMSQFNYEKMEELFKNDQDLLKLFQDEFEKGLEY